jgi:acetylornithine deacetylase/succinyl-diaminopimelate desuccinylase-like protein
MNMANWLDAHTGSTPFSDRADALLLAARLITHSHRLATKHKALASTGILNLTTGSTNTIPGHVSFTLDIRSPSDETVEKLEEELRRDFDLLAQGTDVDGLLAGSTYHCLSNGEPTQSQLRQSSTRVVFKQSENLPSLSLEKMLLLTFLAAPVTTVSTQTNIVLRP